MHRRSRRAFSRSSQQSNYSIAKRSRATGHHRLLRCEPLEDRRMLSVASGLETDTNEAIQLFSTSTALFVENQGQWADETVRYGFNGDGANIAFTDDGLSFYLSQREAIDGVANEHDPLRHDLEMEPFDRFEDSADYITHSTQFTVQFDGANAVTPIGLQQAESYFNYFIGDQSKWRSNVPGYEVVAYENLYAGIDLHTFGRRDSLKYEFYVAPGADYSQISISYDGILGLWIDDTGALHVDTELGELIDDAPYIYQVVDGQQIEVDGQFALVDDLSYSFDITGPYDPYLELIIDPDLAWSTYLGGSDYDEGRGIAVDAAGAAYVTGYTYSSNFPTTAGAHDTIHNGDGDAFVAKLASGGMLVYATYLGGSDWDSGFGIAVDAAGAAYVSGNTRSSNFPTTAGAHDTSFNGDLDAFVAKLASGGMLVYATFLGGSSGDSCYGIAVDAAGAAYVTGLTDSSDLPTTAGAHDTIHNGNADAFVAKLSSTGGSLVYATYLGGSDWDDGYGIAVDAAGAAYVTGPTYSSNFPTTAGAHDTSFNGDLDAFVAKLSSTGGSLVYATYLGGSDWDDGYGIAVDAAGAAYVTGWTGSSDFPTTAGAFDISYNGGNYDAFVAKLSSTGGSLVYATYLGGSMNDGGKAIAVDAAGAAYVTGSTYSSNFPTTAGAHDTSFNGLWDAFVAKLSSGGSLVYATYLGGSDHDYVDGIAVDAAGAAYVTGYTYSSNFPTTAGAHDTSFNGGDEDAFVAKLYCGGTPAVVADFDSDGDVDSDDLDTWKSGFGTTNGANLDDGDADGDGDVDGSDFLAWQLNFGSSSSSGSAATSPAGLGANESGSGAFLSKSNASSDSSNNTKDNLVGLVRSIAGNGQDTFIVPLGRQRTSFETVDYAGWSMPQPMPKTNGSSTAWLGLPQFQSRDAARLFLRDQAVDAVMSRMDGQTTRTDLEYIHDRVRDITLTELTTSLDEIGMAYRAGKTSIREITSPSTTVENRTSLETALEELVVGPMFKSRSVIRV